MRALVDGLLPHLNAAAVAVTILVLGAGPLPGLRAQSPRTPAEAGVDGADALLREAEQLLGKGDVAAAGARLQQAIGVFESITDPSLQVRTIEALWRAGYIAYQVQDARTALRLWSRVLEHREQTLAPVDRSLLEARGNVAMLMRMLGDPGGALALEQMVYDALVSSVPDDDRMLQMARGNLGLAKMDAGDLRGAQPLIERMHEGLEKTEPPDSFQLQIGRSQLAGLLSDLGDDERAAALLQSVLDVYGRILPPDHREVQRTRTTLAEIKKTRGDLVGARDLEQEVLAAYERTLPPEHELCQIARLSIAETHRLAGDGAEAVAVARRVLDQFAANAPSDPGLLAKARRQLGAALFTAGELPESERQLRQVLLDLAAVHNPLDNDVLVAKKDLATVLKTSGDFAGALELGEQVCRTLEAHVPDTAPVLQSARLDLATTKKGLGDVRGAIDLEARVYVVYAATLHPDHPMLQQVCINLGSSEFELGNIEAALRLHRAAFDSMSRTLPPEHHDLLVARFALAASLDASGHSQEAIDLLRASPDLHLPPTHPERLAAQANLAYALYSAGHLDEALALQGQAIDAMRRTLPDHHPLLQETRVNLARTRMRSGDPAGARAVLAEAVRAAREHARFVMSTFGDRVRAEATRLGESIVGALLSVSTFAPDTAESVATELDSILAFRGQTARTARVDDWINARAAHEPRLAGLLAGFRAASRSYGEALQRDAQDETRLRQKREAAEAAESELARAAAADPAWRQLVDVPPLAATTAAMTAESALAVTVNYRREDPSDPHRALRSAAVFVAGAHGIVRIDLENGDELETLCAAYRNELSTQVRTARGRDPEAGRDPDAGRTRPRLGAVFAPVVAALPRTAKTLYLCADGALASIPWAAIPDGDSHLGRRLQIVCLEHPQALTAVDTAHAGEVSLLAFGGIAFAAEPTSALVATSGPVRGPIGVPDRPWADLPGSLAEAQRACDLFAETHPGGKFALFRGADASRDRFVAEAGRHRILHLATHAFVSGLDDAHDPRTGQQTSSCNPGLLAGIVFAGANAADPAVRARAVLTATELRTLDLSGCALTVLSACDTNVGARRFGEAATGLNRALLLAGADATITSLWKVDDQGAAAFFTAFYAELWQNGCTVARAFELARQHVIEAGFGPSVWAGFVLYLGSIDP